MTNEIILVPKDETKEAPPLVSQVSPEKERVNEPIEKKLPDPAKEIPIDHWIMPPEQQGYIQANDNDCL